jgi:hypothetical protein
MRAHVWTPGEDESLVHGYENGEAIDSMHKRMRIGRSSIYRRLKDLGIPPREPRKKSPATTYRSNFTSTRTRSSDSYSTKRATSILI